MSSFIRIAIAILLILHGFIHFIGTIVYCRLGEPSGFTYKTTLLGGKLDLGTTGIWIFGLVWLIAGIGTIIAGIGWLAQSSWTVPTLLATTVLSLIICILDWELAKAGAVIDIVILAAIIFVMNLHIHFS